MAETKKKPAAKKRTTKKQTNPEYVAAVETFFGGRGLTAAEGQIFNAKDPIVKKFPSKFRTVEAVEQTTANPGDTRNIPIPNA